MDGNTIQLNDLEAGRYRFTYFLELESKEIIIEVIKGQRWPENELAIETKEGIMMLRNEKKFLATSDPITESGILRIGVASNNPEKVVCHVFGYRTCRKDVLKKREYLDRLSLKESSQVFKIPDGSLSYAEGRLLGDELTYVMNR